MYKHILIPTDGSERSESAAHDGAQLAAKLGAEITAFYAAPVYVPPYWPGDPILSYDPSPIGEYDKAQAVQARNYLEAVAHSARIFGVECNTIFVQHDPPYRAIIQIAHEQRATSLSWLRTAAAASAR